MLIFVLSRPEEDDVQTIKNSPEHSRESISSSLYKECSLILNLRLISLSSITWLELVFFAGYGKTCISVREPPFLAKRIF